MPDFPLDNPHGRNAEAMVRSQREEEAASEEHELVLVKNGQRYVFRCAHGNESQLLLQLAGMVRDPDSPLDWFDAAMLSHQMGQRLSRRIDRMVDPQKPKV